MFLETERLIIREMDEKDLPDLARILKNPKVMYAYEHDFSDQDVLIWLERQRKRYSIYGFGLWALVLKNTGEMIGQAGITMQKYKGMEVPEIGYLLKERFWHQGYAREAAEKCKEYAFDVLDLEKIYSIIKVDNLPSIKVATSIGMHAEDQFITQYYNGDMLHYLFSMERKDYRRGEASSPIVRKRI